MAGSLRIVHAFAFAFAVAGVAIACAESDGPSGVQGVEVRPVEDILDGEIEIAELTSTSGFVRVRTTANVVCSVVFGTTSAYGSQATDMDMAGGAHRDHNAPLRGLEPDTVYYYRLQGTGPDGTVYVGDEMSFRTPPIAESAARGKNLAGLDIGAEVIDVSSVFGDSADWAAERAIDRDPATEWSSDGDGDAAYLTVRLPAPTKVASIGVWTRTMGSTAQVERFQVVSDGDEILGPFDLPDAAGMHLFTLPEPITAQTLRFEVVASSGGNTGLVEFGAYSE